MSDNFEKSLALTLKFEGGYVDNKFDPGGATNMGVTLKTLSQSRGRPVSKAEVMALTRAEAAQIYAKNYWAPICGDRLPGPVALCVFDFAVNSGVRRSVMELQKVLGLHQDGVIGLVTLKSACKGEPALLVHALILGRRAFLHKLPTFRNFGRGWLARVNAVEAVAKVWAASEHPHAAISTLMETQMPDQAQIDDTHSSAALLQPGTANLAGLDAVASALAVPAMEPDNKPFWASQTIWSSFAVIGASATGAIMAWKAGDMAAFGAAITGILGGVNAIVGRYKASAKIR